MNHGLNDLNLRWENATRTTPDSWEKKTPDQILCDISSFINSLKTKYEDRPYWLLVDIETKEEIENLKNTRERLKEYCPTRTIFFIGYKDEARNIQKWYMPLLEKIVILTTEPVGIHEVNLSGSFFMEGESCQ